MLDYSWITERIAVGGGIWTAENMAEIARLGFTHIIDMQIEFDDTALAEPYGIAVLWNPTDDDFKPKPPSLLRRGVEFALTALYPGFPLPGSPSRPDFGRDGVKSPESAPPDFRRAGVGPRPGLGRAGVVHGDPRDHGVPPITRSPDRQTSRTAIYELSKQEAAAVKNGQRIRYSARDSMGGGSGARLYIHCAAGVHRAPMMTLAILRASGWSLTDAADLLVSRRPVADLADVYVRSVETFMHSFAPAADRNLSS